MLALRFLFSPYGRLAAPAFAVAAVALYVAGAASQLLTTPDILARTGLWPFAVVQALLTWTWFCLHAKRLRDGNRSIGPAAGASLLYALAVGVLLFIAALSLTAPATPGTGDPNASVARSLLLLLLIVAILLSWPRHDLAGLIVAILAVIALLPLLFALAVTVWAGTRARAGAAGAAAP